jgi:hypothetical protein
MYRPQFVSFAALLVLVSGSGFAQQTSAAPASTPAAPSYSKESVVYDLIATSYRYEADGASRKTLTVRARVQSDNGVRQLGVVAFDYASQEEHIDVAYLRVRKPDGSVVDTPASDQQDMPAEVTREAPMYSDLREVQIPVKSLVAGDILEYQIQWVTEKPLIPGQFWGAEGFPSTAVILSQTTELSFPKDKYVQVLSANFKPEITDEDGRKVYRWKYAQLKPTAELDKKKTPDPDAMPDIAWTTFRSWQEIGEWFGGLARERAGVTPEIQAKAQQLIAGKTTDDQKIEAIYNFVSTQVRYVGVAFGIGRFQPHAAETVLENQYGDCKDKHTLLAALLKAAGYDAWPVLISDSIKLHPEFPSPSQFDHVITVVPLHGSNLWLDSTPEVTPYKMLVAPLRDKDALVIPANAPPQVERTPAAGPFPFSDTYTVTGKLDAQGTLDAHFDMQMRGDSEVVFREIFHAAPRQQWDQVVQNISQSVGFGGAVTNVDISSPEQTDKPFHYAYDYSRKDYSDWDNHRIFVPNFSVAIPDIGDDAPTKPIELGTPHREIRHDVVELPPGYSAVLPSSVKYTTSFADYQADYKLDGHTLVVDREFVVLKGKVPIDQADELRKFARNISDDQNQNVQLAASGSATAGADSPNPDLENLLTEALQAYQQKDFAAARADLERAEKLDARLLNLWTAFSYVELGEHHTDLAIADLQKEIEYHPDNTNAYRALASTQIWLKHPEQAEQTYRGLLKAEPGDSTAQALLAGVLVQEKKYDEAATLYEAAQKASPGDEKLAIAAGHAELLGGKHDEGIATLHAVLNGATDPELLNNAAYELAEANLELPLAEASTKKSLDLLDTKTAQLNLGNLAQDDLGQMRLLIATWDTMGWVYFREGNLPLAESYLLPAWRSSQEGTTGEHLRQTYLKEGKQKEADAIAKENFQADRTFTLPKLGTKGSADFFLLLSPKGVEDVQFATGDESLKTAAPLLRKLDLSGQVPKDSSARLLRRGVVFCAEVEKECQFVLIPPQSVTLN